MVFKNLNICLFENSRKMLNNWKKSNTFSSQELLYMYLLELVNIVMVSQQYSMGICLCPQFYFAKTKINSSDKF